MINTKDKVADAAASARPYVERALRDKELRDNVRNAYSSARAVYEELASRRKVSDAASRLAGDKDIQDEIRNAIGEIRNAAGRVQAVKRERAEPGARREERPAPAGRDRPRPPPQPGHRPGRAAAARAQAVRQRERVRLPGERQQDV